MNNLNKSSWIYERTAKRTNSFAGGTPFLDASKKIPTDAFNEPLHFIFQADLEEVDIYLGSGFPTTGFLQFFVPSNDLYGMNLDDITESGNAVIRYLSAKDAVHRDLALSNDSDESPLDNPDQRVFYTGSGISVAPDESCIEYDDDRNSDSTVTLVNEAPEFYLGGYPSFTQSDFREGLDDPYEVSLILGSFSGSNVMWGDMGCAGFWVPEEDLIESNFANGFIYWDCY